MGLAVVIGEATRRPMRVEHALDVVAGYLCLNDVSARDVQFADGQWTRGKSFDTFCPIGRPSFPPRPLPTRRRCGSAVA